MRYCYSRETLLELEIDYLMHSSHICKLLHNAATLISAYWVPNHLRLLSPAELWHYCTPDSLKNIATERTIFLAIDNMEVPIDHSLNLVLQTLTYSGKLSHQNTLKICLFVGLDGTIFARCPVYGGATPEISPVENWFVAMMASKWLTRKCQLF
jgi:hypothetical protein